MKHCDLCNIDVSDSFRFCPFCASSLSDPRRCSNCNELAQAKWEFCTACGTSLSSDRPQTPLLPSDIQQLPEDLSTQAGSGKSRYRDHDDPYVPNIYIELNNTRHIEMKAAEATAAGDDSQTIEVPSLLRRYASSTSDQSTAVNITAFRDNPVQQTDSELAIMSLSDATDVRRPPTLAMLESYGAASDDQSQLPWWHVAALGMILLLFVGAAGVGGWYWWSHSNSATQLAVESGAPEQGPVSEEPSSSPPVPTVTKIQSVTNSDDEFGVLRDRRIKAQAADKAEILGALEEAQKKYPNDYRFPYERAKLSITGITSHHEAFGALAEAAEAAIENGKTREMLNDLSADSDGDFYKLSHGHSEWRTLQEALRNKDKGVVKAMYH